MTDLYFCDCTIIILETDLTTELVMVSQFKTFLFCRIGRVSNVLISVLASLFAECSGKFSRLCDPR